ncbi:MAG: hypothetical protein Q9180_003627 [Flavoplaca navasiana]
MSVDAIEASWKIPRPTEFQATLSESITMEYVQNCMQPHIKLQETGSKSDPMSGISENGKSPLFASSASSSAQLQRSLGRRTTLPAAQTLKKILPSLFSSTGQDDANGSLRPELLPAFDLAARHSRYSLRNLKPQGAHPPFRPASLLPEGSGPSPPHLDYDSAQDAVTIKSPSPCLPSCLDRPPFTSRQRWLHRSPGSLGLRIQARWQLDGPRDIPLDTKTVETYRPTGSPDHANVGYGKPITPRKPKVWIEASSNEESVEEAACNPFVWKVPLLTAFQQVTTVTSPSKPRLVTISPRRPCSPKISSQPTTPLRTPRALVSAFSPDTPPETPDVADLSKDDAGPTYQNVTEQRLASLDTKISEPLTPPNSRIPTPLDKFDKITYSASACLQDHSCWPPPTMTQLDPSITWILQELEVLLADFRTSALRLNSPVIERLRAMTSGVSVADTPARQYFSIAPHSRFSPYRPFSSHPTSPQSMLHRDRSPRASNASPAPQADTTAFALQKIFPQARPDQLESLQATYLAFQFIVNLPSSEFAMASSSGVAASPFASSMRHSRSSSLASNIPAKARAMLGLHSPVQSPASVPSPAVSWYRANSPELDSDVKVRLENVESLLETCVRGILIEIEGRPLGQADDALFRAVGEVIKMGERKTAAARW